MCSQLRGACLPASEIEQLALSSLAYRHLQIWAGQRSSRPKGVAPIDLPALLGFSQIVALRTSMIDLMEKNGQGTEKTDGQLVDKRKQLLLTTQYAWQKKQPQDSSFIN